MRAQHKYLILAIFLTIGLHIAAQITTSSNEEKGRGSLGGFQTGNNNPKGQQDQGSQESKTKGKDTLRIRACLIDEFLGEKKFIDFDTTALNFQNNTLPERLNTISASHLGNLGSPIESRIFTDRTEKSAFLFMKPYELWVRFPSDFVFMNTTKPYSNIKYLKTFGDDKTDEENFKFTYSANVNKYLNIGADYEIIYARGLYTHNSTRDKLANLFGNYQSPRYEAFLKTSFNYIENYENGGITDDRYITDPLTMSGGLKEYESLNIPVNLDDARSLVRNSQFFFNHKYNIGFEKPNKKDTTTMEFVPVTSIIHTLFIDKSQKGYHSETVNRDFYDSAYISNSFTADTSSLLLIRNTVGLSLREGFHEWVKMGLTAFIEHDFRRYMELSADAPLADTTNVFSRYSHHNENLIWTGAELYKHQGSLLTYSVLAKLCIIGEDMGNFELSGNLNSDFKLFSHPVLIAADGYIINRHPDYFLEHYYSNHFIWNNDLSNEYKTKVSGSLDIPDLGFKFNATVENLTNFVYFNSKAVPEQYIGNIQVLTACWKQALNLGVLHWDNDIVYQISSDNTRLPLPKITVYSNLYVKGLLSKVLTTQLGIDCRYFTSYYANAYMPATGQFYNQQDVRIGNYPYMNAYANFHLKRMRFFVVYSHASRLFADPQYFSAPHYPLNPTAIKVGLSWNFYD